MVKLYQTLANLQTRIEQANAVNIDRNIENYHAELSLRELGEIIKEPEVRVQGMIFTQPSDRRYKEPHLFLHPYHRETLRSFPPINGVTPRNLEATATAIEEISHWVYDIQHKEKFGRYSHGAATELIGAIDKYYILHSFRTENISEQELMRNSFEVDDLAIDHSLRDPQYVIAHKLAKAFVNELNRKNIREAGRERVRAYHLEDLKLLQYLIQDKGLKMDNLSKREYDQVIALLLNMGL
jgi:hypothetical protein